MTSPNIMIVQIGQKKEQRNLIYEHFQLAF